VNLTASGDVKESVFSLALKETSTSAIGAFCNEREEPYNSLSESTYFIVVCGLRPGKYSFLQSLGVRDVVRCGIGQ
jgi:hypothetical protein